jgi:CRP-like cAMP-binding protein
MPPAPKRTPPFEHVWPRNRLLRALSQGQLQRLDQALTRRAFAARAPLYDMSAPIDAVYFIESGMVSVTLSNEAGETVEVAAMGREGFAGVAAALGFETSPAAICFQIPGEAIVMSVDLFRREIATNDEFRSVLMCYVRARYVQMVQTILCNRQHTVHQRLARWLLMARDYSGLERFPLTQALMSEMLGVYRPSVSAVAGALQDAGLIKYERGMISIADGKGLEAVSCSCYRIVQDRFEALLPPE